MDIHETRADDIVVLAPDGNLTAAADCQTLERKIAELFDAHTHRIVIDGADIGQIASGAVRVLLRMSRKLQPLGGGIVLCALNDRVRLAFEISGFDQDFIIVLTRKAAVAKAAALVPIVAAAPAPAPVKPAKAGKGPRSGRFTPVPAAAGSAAQAAHPLRAGVLRALALGLVEAPWRPALAGAGMPPSQRAAILELLKK